MNRFCVLVPPSLGSMRDRADRLSKRDALQRFQLLMRCIGASHDAWSCDGVAVLRRTSMKQVREQVLVSGGGPNVALGLAAELQ